MASNAIKATLRKARAVTPSFLDEKPRRKVIEGSHVLVAEGFRIEIRVPASLDRDENGENGKPYLVKKLYAAGNRFCLHIYGDGLNQFRGKRVRLDVKIQQKTFEDGGVEFYANGFKTDDQPTHRLIVYARTSDYTPKDGDVTFPVGEGIAVISPEAPRAPRQDAA